MKITPTRRAPSSRDPVHQWLALEPNRIEKQYWKDLWRYRELFAILAWALMRPTPFWCLRRCCPGSFLALR